MRKKLSIVNQIDAICQVDIPILTKWKMAIEYAEQPKAAVI